MLIRRHAVLVLVLLLTVAALPTLISRPVHAAEPCAPAAVIAAANALKPTGDPMKDVELLQAFVAQARDEIVKCKGLKLEGKGDKIDVADIPAGLYAVRFNGDGAISIKRVDGECGQSSSGNTVFFELTNKANPYTATIVKIGAKCKAAVEVSLSSTTWTITFEPLAQ